MQGLSDGYFVIPFTIGGYFAGTKLEKVSESDAAFEDCKKQTEERIHKLLSVKGHRTVNEFHRELGNIMWEYVGMARNEAGLKTALEKIPALRQEFWEDVNVVGSEGSFNQNLERAGRVADFLEFAEVLTLDALHRKESCGGHFREESQTPEGEAKRDDENFCYVGAWEYKGDGVAPELSKEPLTFDNVHLATRSYK
jgi:succinate dehydrogenase / fumarate reductase flavoprotein subunit